MLLEFVPVKVQALVAIAMLRHYFIGGPKYQMLPCIEALIEVMVIEFIDLAFMYS